MAYSTGNPTLDRLAALPRVRCSKHGVCSEGCTSECNTGEHMTDDEAAEFWRNRQTRRA